ncbi:hypothetical protein ACJX0J_011367, partial [Zea mays]
ACFFRNNGKKKGSFFFNGEYDRDMFDICDMFGVQQRKRARSTARFIKLFYKIIDFSSLKKHHIKYTK